MGRGVGMLGNVLLFGIFVYTFGASFLGKLNLVMLAAIVVALFLLPFIIGPLLIHKNYWSSLEPSLVPFDPEGPASQEDLRSHFADTAEEFRRFGFKPERYYRTKQAFSNADGSVLLFQNEETCETVRVVSAASRSGKNSASHLVFSSEFSDGTEVITSNRSTSRIYPPAKPPYYGRAFPQVRDVGYLLLVHRARVENLAAGRIPFDSVAGDPDGYIRRVDFEEPYAHFVACGYNYVDEMARVHRLTWKGAILAAWKSTSPVKQIRLFFEKMIAARQLSNLKAGRPVY